MKISNTLKYIFTKENISIVIKTILLVIVAQLLILSLATKATNNIQNAEVIDIKLITMENIPKDKAIQITSVDLVFNITMPFRKDNVVKNIDDFETLNLNLKDDGIIDRIELEKIEKQIKDELIGIKYKKIMN